MILFLGSHELIDVEGSNEIPKKKNRDKQRKKLAESITPIKIWQDQLMLKIEQDGSIDKLLNDMQLEEIEEKAAWIMQELSDGGLIDLKKLSSVSMLMPMGDRSFRKMSAGQM